MAAFVALVTILFREVLSVFLPDTHWYYVLTILVSYIVGMFLSFELQKKITFKNAKSEQYQKKWLFFMIAISIALLSSGLSYFIRYYLEMDKYVGQWSAMLSFAVSVAFCSVLSFALNKIFVFR